MGRTLRYLGFALLAGAIWMELGDSAGWVSSATASTWAKPCFFGGVLLLASGLLLAFVGPWVRRLSGGRCVRCGAATGRGQAYCWDHLQETVNEYRDHSRNTGSRHSRGA